MTPKDTVWGMPKQIAVLLASLPFMSFLLLGVGLVNKWSIIVELAKGIGFAWAMLLGAVLGIYKA